jgi:uncharacterized protein (TIGR03435 family)
MQRSIDIAWLAALLACASAGQTAAPLSFEVASVKPAEPPVSGQFRATVNDGDRVDLYITLRNCITLAYRVKDNQVSAPAWLNHAWYDIVAKRPAGTGNEQVPEMMQTLLAERFKLAIHRETKEFAGFALVVGKNGPKLAKAAPDGAVRRSSGRMSATPGEGGKFEDHAITMDRLADALPRILGQPVVNATQLAGEYDVSFEYAPLAAGSDLGVSIFKSIQDLGLKLEPRKIPLDIVVVDHAEQTPTGN